MKQNGKIANDNAPESFSPPETNSGSLLDATLEMASSDGPAPGGEDAPVNNKDDEHGGVLLLLENKEERDPAIVVLQKNPSESPGGHQDAAWTSTASITGVLGRTPVATTNTIISTSIETVGAAEGNGKGTAESLVLVVHPSSESPVRANRDVAPSTNMLHEELDSKRTSDKNNSDEEVQEEKQSSTATGGRKLHNDAELRCGVMKMVTSTCDSHRDLLFGLFLRSTTASELEYLSRKSGARLAEVVKCEKRVRKNRRKKRTWWEGNDYARLNSTNSGMQEDEDDFDRRSKKERVSAASDPDTAKIILPLPSPISLVSLALERSPRKQDYVRNRKRKVVIPPIRHDTGREGSVIKRPDHESLTLRELETKIMLKFESCPSGAKAIATDNSQYEWYLTKSGDMVTKPSVLALPLAAPPAQKHFSAMSLIYNECSLNAFASWTTSSPSMLEESASAPRPPAASMASAAPASSALFHCCQVCEQWGHQELECESLDGPAFMSEIADEVTALRSIRDRPRLEREEDELTTRVAYGQGGSRSESSVTAASASCMVCKLKVRKEWRQSYLVCGECRSQCHVRCCASPPPEGAPLVGGWLCTTCSTNQSDVAPDVVVEIEGCEGFVIEQRTFSTAIVSGSSNAQVPPLLSKSLGIDFGERSWSRALCVTDTKSLADISVKRRTEVVSAQVNPSEPPVVVVAAATPAPSTRKSVGKQHAFSEGEFCWAKREHAEKGKFARDEWWPAQVLASINENRSVKYFSMEVTPYLVRFFGISRASRVRASSAIPFFQNFRAIGYQRFLAQNVQETVVDHGFRKGVEEAISLMGFKSVGQILARADEIVQAQMPTALLLNVLPQRRFMARKLENDGFVNFKQDSFVIYARESADKKRLSVNVDLTEGTTKEEHLVETRTKVKGPVRVYHQTRLTGCLVAWRSAPDDSSRGLSMKVGTVMAADVENKLALVSPIADWESKLTSPSSKAGVVVTDYQACSAEWLSMEKLHMLCNGPDEDGEQVISKEVVSGLLSSARDAVSDELQKGVAELPIFSEEEEPTRPIEAILKERKSYSGREYLVKWKSSSGQALFPSLGTVWVPEQYIRNPNMVLRYQIDYLLSAFSLSAQTKVESPASCQVIAALTKGMAVVEASLEGPIPVTMSQTNARLCPFCKLTLDDMHSFADHIKEHQEEPNYSLIREAARLSRMSWYDNADIDKP